MCNDVTGRSVATPLFTASLMLLLATSLLWQIRS